MEKRNGKGRLKRTISGVLGSLSRTASLSKISPLTVHMVPPTDGSEQHSRVEGHPAASSLQQSAERATARTQPTRPSKKEKINNLLHSKSVENILSRPKGSSVGSITATLSLPEKSVTASFTTSMDCGSFTATITTSSYPPQTSLMETGAAEEEESAYQNVDEILHELQV